jgi:methionine synthase I (cobalamin-dependent)
MTNPLVSLLNQREYLIADGATGTNMMSMGLKPGSPPDFWNTEHADKVEGLHRGFVEAGSDVLLTNTFGSNAVRLILDKAEHRTRELNEAGALRARAAADSVDRSVIVAGSMGPTGGLMEPLGELTPEEALAAYIPQAEALAEGGADVLWIETIFDFGELAAAVQGAASTGLPVVSTMTFDTASRTMMGDTPEKAFEFVHSLPNEVAAFGANCGAGPSMLIDTICGLSRGAREGDIIVAKGNCGMPVMLDGEVVYSGTVEIMATYARLARDAGARIIGGCCGTTPDHVRGIADALCGYQPGNIPDKAVIEASLGPIKPLPID